MAHEGLTSAIGPRDPRGHAPMEGGGARLLERRHRRGARQHAAAWGEPAGAAPCPPGSWPALRSCALPSGRLPAPPMPGPPRPLRLRVVDLGCHHSMRRRRLATPMPMDRAARSGKRAGPWGAESGHARAQGASPFGAHCPPRKSPCVWSLVLHSRGQGGKTRATPLTTPNETARRVLPSF